MARGFSRSRLKYWSSRVPRARRREVTRPEFVEGVVLQSRTVAVSVRAGEAVVEVDDPTRVSPAWVARLVAKLTERPCS
jgi:hypothetical protein